ncbi:DUF3023 domain-containing protein [Ehrlichia canis]|uniref:Uncharacterized protein n=1 Tax=Ehrlichia canis (strain Jake) TaxID=269484 RepID=A0ACA6AW72_EHRCJ|nr:DUF3023 domain-containing protein [Ehrlichia canis]AAZ68471.1 hypothetical protein Ecaj_0429 [Ehrlichia canis str. Jake]
MLVPQEVIASNSLLCEYVKYTTINIKSATCIGSTDIINNKLKIHISKDSNLQPIVQPHAKSLFLLEVTIPSSIVKNDPYLRNIYIISQSESLDANLYCLVDASHIQSFTNEIYDTVQNKVPKFVDNIFKYTEVIFAKLEIDSHLKLNEYEILCSILPDAEFIIHEIEEKNSCCSCCPPFTSKQNITRVQSQESLLQENDAEQVTLPKPEDNITNTSISSTDSSTEHNSISSLLSFVNVTIESINSFQNNSK